MGRRASGGGAPAAEEADASGTAELLALIGALCEQRKWMARGGDAARRAAEAAAAAAAAALAAGDEGDEERARRRAAKRKEELRGARWRVETRLDELRNDEEARQKLGEHVAAMEQELQHAPTPVQLQANVAAVSPRGVQEAARQQLERKRLAEARRHAAIDHHVLRRDAIEEARIKWHRQQVQVEQRVVHPLDRASYPPAYRPQSARASAVAPPRPHAPRQRPGTARAAHAAVAVGGVPLDASALRAMASNPGPRTAERRLSAMGEAPPTSPRENVVGAAPNAPPAPFGPELSRLIVKGTDGGGGGGAGKQGPRQAPTGDTQRRDSAVETKASPSLLFNPPKLRPGSSRSARASLTAAGYWMNEAAGQTRLQPVPPPSVPRRPHRTGGGATPRKPAPPPPQSPEQLQQRRERASSARSARAASSASRTPLGLQGGATAAAAVLGTATEQKRAQVEAHKQWLDSAIASGPPASPERPRSYNRFTVH